MREVLASIPGFSSIKPRRRTNKKMSTAAQIEQTREGCIDLETPDSILVSFNLRDLLNNDTFSTLPPLYQYKLVQLLPSVDRPAIDNETEQIRLNSTSLTNTFFTRACLEWKERLADGEFTPENQLKLRSEAEKEKIKLDPWKLKHFEPIWGTKNPKARVPATRHATRHAAAAAAAAAASAANATAAAAAAASTASSSAIVASTAPQVSLSLPSTSTSTSTSQNKSGSNTAIVTAITTPNTNTKTNSTTANPSKAAPIAATTPPMASIARVSDVKVKRTPLGASSVQITTIKSSDVKNKNDLALRSRPLAAYQASQQQQHQTQQQQQQKSHTSVNTDKQLILSDQLDRPSLKTTISIKTIRESQPVSSDLFLQWPHLFSIIFGAF